MAYPKRKPSPYPTFSEEISLQAQDYSIIAGIDEVGRGPLAGPVVAGVAILAVSRHEQLIGRIRDSKLMTSKQRVDHLPLIKCCALATETGSSSPREIDEMGIVNATFLAMKRALQSLSLTPDFLLVDAFTIPEVEIPQKAIIGGDRNCLSIAAASIVAKVERDAIMDQMAMDFPGYGLEKHKGYGTKEHISKLQKLGPSPMHRRSFRPVNQFAFIAQVSPEH